MTDLEEIKIWFRDLLQNCYKKQICNYIYYIYNPQYLRLRKMSKITGDNIDLKELKDGSKIIFYDDYVFQIFWIDFDIWYLADISSAEMQKLTSDIISDFLGKKYITKWKHINYNEI